MACARYIARRSKPNASAACCSAAVADGWVVSEKRHLAGRDSSSSSSQSAKSPSSPAAMSSSRSSSESDIKRVKGRPRLAARRSK